MDAWLEYYRSLDAAGLADELAWLKKQIRNPFGAQTEGGRSVSRSTAEFRDRIAAATRVQNERTGEGDTNRHLVADFGEVQL
jgi:hypothetical protein